MRPEQNVRWGIAGLGKIAHRWVRDLNDHVPHGILHGVGARDQDRASQFADQYRANHAYGSYQAMAEDPQLDAVYVATLHPFHRPLVELFLRAGKHVLVEKPAFTCCEDWQQMVALAQDRSVLLLEAMKTATFPAYRALCDFIQQHQIELEQIEASFGHHHPYDATQPLFDPTLCGGATLDVGVYLLWLFVDLCRCNGVSPSSMQVLFEQDNPMSRVDENSQFLFEGAIKGRLNASITRDLPRAAVLNGKDFSATIHGKWWNPLQIDIEYQGRTFGIHESIVGGGFQYEIQHMGELIFANERQSPLLRHDVGLTVCHLMQQSLLTFDEQFHFSDLSLA